ncbi:MAG: ABC transporter ATP-binding protein [Sphaerochaetaceae bacterium]
MRLEVDGVEFDYASHTILHDVGFQIRPQDFLAVLGPNGVGKTTLLKCLDRVLEPSRGSVLVNHKDTRAMRKLEVARLMAYVPQRSEVSRMCVYDLILLGRKPHFNWTASAYDHQLTAEIIESMGLADLSLRYVDEISGGEFQLVQIARALVQQPQVLLLDEPTSSLDIGHQHRIMSTIREVVQAKAMTAVVAIHDINLSIRYCNRFLLMKDGYIHAFGGKEVITPKNIAAVYQIDVSVGEFNGIPIVVPT